MQVGDFFVDHDAGYSGVVVSILLFGGEHTDAVEEEDHDLISAVCIQLDNDQGYAVVETVSGSLTWVEEVLH